MSRASVPPSGDPPRKVYRYTPLARALLVSSVVTLTTATTYVTTSVVVGDVPAYWHVVVVGSALATLALLVALLRCVAREERSRRGPA